MKDLRYIPSCEGNMGSWKERHQTAVRVPAAIELPFLTMLQGWLDYAKAHKARFDSEIGADYVLGDAWAMVGVALNDLLNGDIGIRLDCGTLNTIIIDNLTEQGFDHETGKRL